MFHCNVRLCNAVGDGNKATAAALRARLMQGKQPSMVLGPNPDSAQNSTQGSAAVTESRAKSVQLSAIDSEGRAVPGAFGRAAVGAGAPEGGRKPKRVRRLERNQCFSFWYTQLHAVSMVKAISIIYRLYFTGCGHNHKCCDDMWPPA